MNLLLDPSYYFDKSGLRPNIADTLEKLQLYNELPGYSVGITGLPSEHLQTTIWFVNTLNNSEAHKLINHPKTFIKMLALKRLYLDNDILLFNLLVEASNDTSLVYEQHGCTGRTYSKFEYLLKTIHYFDSTIMEDSVYFTKEQKKILDSLVKRHALNNIYQDNK